MWREIVVFGLVKKTWQWHRLWKSCIFQSSPHWWDIVYQIHVCIWHAFALHHLHYCFYLYSIIVALLIVWVMHEWEMILSSASKHCNDVFYNAPKHFSGNQIYIVPWVLCSLYELCTDEGSFVIGASKCCGGVFHSATKCWHSAVMRFIQYTIRRGFTPWEGEFQIPSPHWKRKENTNPFLPGMPWTNMWGSIFPA